MRVVVTGAAGFIGSFLVEALVARGDEVDGWTRAAVDIADAHAVSAAFERFAPEAVVHLAAQSLPGRSWDDAAESYRVNVGGTINLLAAARRAAVPPRILVAGSSAEYAEPVGGGTIAEDARIEPNSPYASSKSAASQVAEMYGRRYGLEIVRFRPFALVGPRKTGDACSDFARRIVALERGAERTLRVGDVSVVRDMIDVRDGVSGIVRVLERGVAGEAYNICGGSGIALERVLETFRRLATVPVEISTDPALLRPLEQRVKIGDPSKLRALGWAPSYALETTLGDILSYWRASTA